MAAIAEKDQNADDDNNDEGDNNNTNNNYGNDDDGDPFKILQMFLIRETPNQEPPTPHIVSMRV